MGCIPRSMGYIPIPLCGRPWDNSPMDLQAFIKAVAEAIEAQGLDMKPLSLKIGQSETYVRDLLKGRSKRPGAPGLLALAQELGIDPAETLGISRSMGSVVVTHKVTSGVVTEFSRQLSDSEDSVEAPPMPKGKEGKPLVVVRVADDELLPVFPSGSVLFAIDEPEREAARYMGKPCIVKLRDGTEIVRIPRRGAGRSITLATFSGAETHRAKIDWAKPVRWVKWPE